jgi:hypothetical protein
MNMNNEPTPGVNGWKSGCPPQPRGRGGPDCTKCGNIIDPEDNGNFKPYSNNDSWNNCTKKTPSIYPDLQLPSAECACGYPDKKEWEFPPDVSVGYERPSPPYKIGNLVSEGLDLFLQGLNDFVGYVSRSCYGTVPDGGNYSW